MIRLFISDLREKQRIYSADGSEVSLIKILLSDGSGANFWYRLMQVCARRKLTAPFALVFQYINKLLNHCVIGLKAEFGDGFVIMHPTGVVVNSKVKGGRGIVLESGVVIGDDKGQSPILEDNIFIGSGAKVIGGLRIGSRVKIGANAVVVKDIESDCTAVGIPARKVG